MSYRFSQVTLKGRRHSVQNNLFFTTKTLNEDMQQPENSRAHRGENLTWSKQTGYRKNKQTNKQKLIHGPEGNKFFREKKACRGEDGHTEMWRTTLNNFCTVTGHTFAIQLWQQNHNSSVYHCCCQMFFITALRPLMKGNYKIYSTLHYIHHLNERLKCSCLLQSDWSDSWLFSCCLSWVSPCVSKNDFAF